MTKQKRTSTVTSSTGTKCKCVSRRGAVGLYYAPVDKFGKDVWVCSDCKLPMTPGLESYISRCEDCLDEFSSPWESVCKKCYRIRNSDVKLDQGRVVTVPHEGAPPYRGWAWGRSEDARRYNLMRDTGRLPERVGIPQTKARSL